MGQDHGNGGFVVARQRFIWPTIWDDPVFGRMTAEQQVFFIGCFSIADDEGRLNADPAYLRGALFTYKDYALPRMRKLRDSVAETMGNVCLYTSGGVDYIALLKWEEYQKPKYRKASKLPPPFPEDSPNVDGSFRARTGQDRVGLDRAGQGAALEDSGEALTETPAGFRALDPVARLLEVLTDKDDETERVVRGRLRAYGLGEADLEEAREAAQSSSAVSPTRVAMSVLKTRGEARKAVRAAVARVEQ